jgi:hypothetical protein
MDFAGQALRTNKSLDHNESVYGVAEKTFDETHGGPGHEAQ